MARGTHHLILPFSFFAQSPGVTHSSKLEEEEWFMHYRIEWGAKPLVKLCNTCILFEYHKSHQGDYGICIIFRTLYSVYTWLNGSIKSFRIIVVLKYIGYKISFYLLLNPMTTIINSYRLISFPSTYYISNNITLQFTL